MAAAATSISSKLGIKDVDLAGQRVLIRCAPSPPGGAATHKEERGA